jgi:hypothetical protein
VLSGGVQLGGIAAELAARPPQLEAEVAQVMLLLRREMQQRRRAGGIARCVRARPAPLRTGGCLSHDATARSLACIRTQYWVAVGADP